MEYRYHEGKAYNLHLLKTKKFKTITVLITFKRKVKKEEITIRSFIHSILLLSSKNFPSSRLLSTEAEKLYAPSIEATENIVGNYAVTSFYMAMINDKYTEPGTNNKCMNFFKELLFNPNIENGGFNKNNFNIIKNEITAKLKSIKDSPRYYSEVRMLEHLDPTSPVSYRRGYLEDLDKIDEVKAYEYYRGMLHSDMVDVFVLGDIDFDAVRKTVDDMIPINTIKKQKEGIYVKHKTIRKRAKVVKEEENVKQAKLVIGCKLNNLSDFEIKYVLPVYNGILGGPSYSRLFKSVREQNSLAYYIYSNYRRVNNLLTISSGINKESFDKTVKLIKTEINNMAKGNFDESDLKRAQQDIVNIIKNIEDKPYRLINNYSWQVLYDLDDIETRKKRVFDVTVDDVKKIGKKVHIDTIYLLHGGDDN
ncbi:MAG: insulinase family protein [Bacilli bacterium]|nr:insulinase family protein [Bacilli bacterium]